MFKRLLNECIIDLNINLDGPILIKSGLANISGPDMAFVTVFRNGREEFYLPGSSLKGILRSHAERIVRTFNSDAACDPFGKEDDMSCSASFTKRKDREFDLNMPKVYKDACLTCKLFGSLWFAGRLATSDAYAIGELPKPQRRDGVGIDRFTGGASRWAKFELEVITEGIFNTRLYLRNFELWQLALVGFLLQDLRDGLIRIGTGKSRGLGKVSGEVQQVRLDFLGPRAPKISDGHLPIRGAGSLFDDAEKYGMVCPDEVSIPFSGDLQSNGVRTTALFSKDSFLWAQLAERWSSCIKDYQMPEAMKHYRRSIQR